MKDCRDRESRIWTFLMYKKMTCCTLSEQIVTQATNKLRPKEDHPKQKLARTLVDHLIKNFSYQLWAYLTHLRMPYRIPVSKLFSQFKLSNTVTETH